MTDYQGGVRVAAFATGGLIPPAMHGTSVLGAIGITAILLVLLWIFMQIPMG